MFDTYEEYIADLKASEFDVDDLNSEGWKDGLQAKLGRTYEVIAPKMPNPSNAKYLEWKIWFDKITPLMKDGAVLIGHSLGGIFLAKYLAENQLPKKAKAVLLVAAPFSAETLGASMVDFDLPRDLSKLAAFKGSLHFYHSKDDPFVGFANFEGYRSAVPGATFHVFADRGHFIGEKFPEIVKDIKALSTAKK